MIGLACLSGTAEPQHTASPQAAPAVALSIHNSPGCRTNSTSSTDTAIFHRPLTLFHSHSPAMESMMTLYPSIRSVLFLTASVTANRSGWSMLCWLASHSSRCASAMRLLYGLLLFFCRSCRRSWFVCTAHHGSSTARARTQHSQHPACDEALPPQTVGANLSQQSTKQCQLPTRLAVSAGLWFQTGRTADHFPSLQHAQSAVPSAPCNPGVLSASATHTCGTNLFSTGKLVVTSSPWW